MSRRRVTVFFYGSYMNRDVIRELGLDIQNIEVASVTGFGITIRPIANLAPDALGVVYGVVGTMTHQDLESLYAHARDKLGGVYLPEAVIADVGGGRQLPALCYIAPTLKEGPTSAAYVDKILAAARDYDFPRWYLEQLERWAPN